MSEQSIGVTRGFDAPAALPWLVAGAVYLLLMMLGARLLADPDTYWHIALGRLILDQHTLPTSDPFSATMRGTPWVAYEWLSQVVFTLAYRLGGWTAVAVVAAVAAATAFAQLTRYLLARWQPVPAIIAVLAALTLVAPHIVARPHVLALPLLVSWIAELIRTVDDDRTPPWRLLPVMTLWANLHGSFIFGLAMTGLIAAEAIYRTPAAQRSRASKNWLVFGALAVVAACINPYGPEMIVAALRTLALGPALAIINEWQPQDFSHFDAYELIVIGALGFALWRGVRLPPFRIAMLLGVVHLSLAQSRHADLFGLLAPLFVARPLAEQFPAMAADTRATVAAWPKLPLAAGLILAALCGGAVGALANVAPAANVTPAAAVNALRSDRGPIFNSYEFGGYLDFVGVAPFIDGRTELYGKDFMLRYQRAVTLADLPDFLRLLDEYHIQTTLLIPATPAVALLDRLPQWQRVFADATAVVHTRRRAAEQ
jgi:hypothetical protein